MKLKRAQKIRSVWDALEEGEPGISTERLMALTMDLCQCDTDDVAESLILTEKEKNKNNHEGPTPN